MKKINWGIIGCGDVTELKSGPAFNKVPHSSLIAVMRRDEAKARDYAARHKVPNWYTDADSLIQNEEVNAIYIATPPSSHYEYAIAAIDAGKYVYLEKPMTLNYVEAIAIAKKVDEKKARLVVAHYRREQPMFKQIKQLLLENSIGEVRFVNLLFITESLSREQLLESKTAWRVDPAIAGGGLFHDLAPHQVDLMYYFFGDIESSYGISIKQGNLYNADDMVAGNILFKNGVVFTGSWCFNAPKEAKEDSCTIIGSAGKICFSIFNNHAFEIQNAMGTKKYSFEKPDHVQQPMIEATVNYFLEKNGNPCSAIEGATVMQVIDHFTGK